VSISSSGGVVPGWRSDACNSFTSWWKVFFLENKYILFLDVTIEFLIVFDVKTSISEGLSYLLRATHAALYPIGIGGSPSPRERG
jgi:hypothetical protein